jgi:hypothetical protein
VGHESVLLVLQSQLLAGFLRALCTIKEIQVEENYYAVMLRGVVDGVVHLNRLREGDSWRSARMRSGGDVYCMAKDRRHELLRVCDSSPSTTTIMPTAQIDPLSSSDSIEWSPASWRQKKAKQQPVYADTLKHKKALDKLETLPPLVTAPEVPSNQRSFH